MAETSPAPPFAAGSISLGLHAHAGTAEQIIDGVMDEAGRAVAAGFDGLTFSEHHGGFPGYLPNPTLMAGLVLEHLSDNGHGRVWAGPAPTILPLRHATTVIEDLAWLAARHRGRVCAGFAGGYQERDFDLVGADFTSRSECFWSALGTVTEALSGHATGELGSDPAIAALATRPIPVVAGIGGPLGARRAADRASGILVTSLLGVDDAATLVAQYRSAGGAGPIVLIRRVWVGDDAPTLDQQLHHYRDAGHRPSWMEEPMDDAIYSGAPDVVAERLAHDMTVIGAEALNLRVHTNGVDHVVIADQIGRMTEVIDRLRSLIG